MEHHFTLSGTALTVHLPAELDHCSSQQLRQEIDRLIRVRNIRSILFDFGDTEFMDSSGIALILRSQQRMQLMEGSVVLRNVPEQARRVLDAAGIGRLVSIQ